MRRPAADSPACVRRRWLVEKYDEQRFLLGTEALGGADRAPHERTRGWLSKQGSFVPTWRRRFFLDDPSKQQHRAWRARLSRCRRGLRSLHGTLGA